MLYVLCGPSGSGKTTFLKLLFKEFSDLKIIDLYVFRDNLRSETELGRVEKDKSEFDVLKDTFSNIFTYGNDIYGLKFPSKKNINESYFIIDYPGEYPECKEFYNIPWKGILVLPKIELQLKERLTNCNRIKRIKSSLIEYNECKIELNKSIYSFPKWSVIINNEIRDMEDYIEGIKTVANIVYKK